VRFNSSPGNKIERNCYLYFVLKIV